MRLPTIQNPGPLASALLFVLAGCASPSEIEDRSTGEDSLSPPVAFSGDASEGIPSDPADGREGPIAGEPLAIAFSLASCKTVIAGIPVSAARLAPFIPEGFVPLTPDEFLGIPDPRGDAMLMILIQECERATGPDGEARKAAGGDLHIPVRAPTGFDVQADLHAVRLDPLVAGAVFRESLERTGARIHNGSVAFQEDGPVASWRHVRASMDANGSHFVIEGMPTAPVTGRENFTYAAYTPTSTDALLVWRARLLHGDFTVGEGHAELPPGWARDVVGAETYYFPYVMHAIQDQVEASVTLLSPSAA